MKYIVIKEQLGIQMALKIEGLAFRRGCMRLGEEFHLFPICIIPLTQEGKTESEVKDIAAEITLRRGRHSIAQVDTDKKVVYGINVTLGHGLEIIWEEPSEVYKMVDDPTSDAFISLHPDRLDVQRIYNLVQVM